MQNDDYVIDERPPPTMYVRKKDGQIYYTNMKTSDHLALGPAIYLKPHFHGRSHWKSLVAFKAQYTILDGSKIE